LRHFLRATRYLLISIAFLYAGDWSLFQLRLARGTGLNSVTVEQYMQISLKGNKREYHYIGTTDVNCVRSLLPQYAASEWTAPCWWRERHREIWE
jgi:hypothetical protein